MYADNGKNTMNNNNQSNTPQRIPKIKSLTDVLRAMNRIHREVRQGQLSTQDLGRYVNLYQGFAGMIKDKTVDELAERLEALEDR